MVAKRDAGVGGQVIFLSGLRQARVVVLQALVVITVIFWLYQLQIKALNYSCISRLAAKMYNSIIHAYFESEVLLD